MARRAKKPLPQKGGSGENIDSISSFKPSSIPDLALWIKVKPEAIVKSTIQDYINKQSLTRQDALTALFKDRLNEEVVTEILGTDVRKSLVRFELDSVIPADFPEYIPDPSGLDIISMPFNHPATDGLPHYLKLVTSNTIELPSKFSQWSISKNMSFDYSPTFDNIVASVDGLPASFSEIIVYSRVLTRIEVQKIEGYLAYLKNEQYLLPFHHPYLPDMSSLPVLTEKISQIQDIRNALQEGLKQFNITLNKYRTAHETDQRYLQEPKYRGIITDDLDKLEIIQETFSKGALLSKKKGQENLDSIYASINELQISTVPFSEEFLKSVLSEVTNHILEIQKYLSSFDDFDSKLDGAAKLALVESTSQISEMKSAETEEVFKETQREIEANEYYRTLQARSAVINTIGQTMYAPLYKSLEDKVEVYVNAVKYLDKQVEMDWTAMMTTFTSIDTEIKSKAWLKYLKDVDLSGTQTILRGGLPYSLKYRDPTLNSIQSQYEIIRNQILDGDFGYTKTIIGLKTAEIDAIFTAAKNRNIQPICDKTFLPHCGQRYNEINAYFTAFGKLNTSITASLETIRAALDSMKETESVAAGLTFPVIPVEDRFRKDCETIYIRKINTMDAALTGIEYVVTDSEGELLETTTEQGDIDNNFLFPSYMKTNFNKEDNTYLIYHTYKDENGKPLLQEIKVLDPMPDIFIIDSIAEIRRPNYWFHNGNKLLEISREQGNGIHQFASESLQYPIQLPKYGLAVGTYFLIQNVGDAPIQVQIPSTTEDTIDLIGPDDSILYIFSNLNESEGPTYYGRVPWRSGYIPYDTLLKCPRSAYSVIVTELNSSIYVSKNLEPLYDSNGYFIRPLTDAKGFTYDIDDIYLANPYMVQSLKELHLSDLAIVNSKHVKMKLRPADPEIWALTDAVTGLPILCNSEKIPGINEFGFSKIIKTPLLLIEGAVKIRGAFGDLPIKIADEPIRGTGLHEPFLKFELVYRSKFVQPFIRDAIKTFVFISLSKYPIITPKNTLVEPATWTLMPPQELSYSDSSGQEFYNAETPNKNIKYAYIFNETKPFNATGTEITTQLYPYIYEKQAKAQSNMIKASTIIVNRYAVNKDYILSCLKKIKETYTSIQALGKGATDALSLLDTANKRIQADFDEFNTYTKNIDSIRAGLMNEIMTNELKITIDMLDLKMRDIVTSAWNTFTAIDDSIQFYLGLVKEVESVEETIRKLRAETLIQIEQRVVSVQSIYQSDAQNFKHTGAPEFDRLLKLIIKYKVDFTQKLAGVELAYRKRPGYSTEISGWAQGLRGQIKQLNGIAIKIREIELTDVPKILKTRENLKRAKDSQTILELTGQVDTYLKYRDAVLLWLGLGQPVNEPYSISNGIPVIKGITIDLVVFEELSNPSVQRDWASITGEFAPRITAELVNPITSLGEKYKDRFILFHNDPRENLESVRANIKGMVDTIIAFETELEPILKSYVSIRSDIRAVYKTKLVESVTAIQSRWITATGKRTAIETSLINAKAGVDAAGIMKNLDALFSFDQEVADVLRGLTINSFYDTMSYYALKTEAHKHAIVMGKLDTLDVGLEKEADRLAASAKVVL